MNTPYAELTLGDTLQGILDNSYGVETNDGLNSFTFDLPSNKVKVTRRLNGWQPQIIVEVDGALVYSVTLRSEDLNDNRVNYFFQHAYDKMKEYEKGDREVALSKFYRIFG
jgi:hypothetical protein